MARQQGFEELDAALESATPVARGREAEGPGETIIEPPVVIDPPDTNGKALAPAHAGGAAVRRKPREEGDPIGVQTRADMRALARLLAASRSHKISGAQTEEDIMFALLAGYDAGLTPTQTARNVFVVNGRATIFGDALLSLVMGHPELDHFAEFIDGDGDTRFAVCEMARVRMNAVGNPIRIKVESVFSVSDAKTAGLWGKAGPWKQYPDRMLKMRARSYAIRDLFPDVIGGLGVTEEVQDYSTRPSFDPDRMAVRPGGALERLGEEGTDAP